jgi:hypothetical protein
MYGPSGSGKTFTFMGRQGEILAGAPEQADSNSEGVLLLALQDLFAEIEEV